MSLLTIRAISNVLTRECSGCGRFWNLHIIEICSLYKRLPRISFCMVRDKCMLLIIPKRNFCLNFKIAAKSLKTAEFPARNLSNVFLNPNFYKRFMKKIKIFNHLSIKKMFHYYIPLILVYVSLCRHIFYLLYFAN